MAIPRNRNSAINQRPDERPQKPRNRRCPRRHDLQAKRQGIDIRDIVPHNAQRQHDQTELPELPQTRHQHRSQQPADASVVIAIRIRLLRDGRRHDRAAEHLRKAERENEACKRPEEDFDARHICRLVNRIIRSVACPPRREAKDARREAEHRPCLTTPHLERQIREIPTMRKLPKHDQKDDKTRNP